MPAKREQRRKQAGMDEPFADDAEPKNRMIITRPLASAAARVSAPASSKAPTANSTNGSA